MAWEPSRPRPPRTRWQEVNKRPRVVIEAALQIALVQQQLVRDDPWLKILRPEAYRPWYDR